MATVHVVRDKQDLDLPDDLRCTPKQPSDGHATELYSYPAGALSTLPAGDPSPTPRAMMKTLADCAADEQVFVAFETSRDPQQIWHLVRVK